MGSEQSTPNGETVRHPSWHKTIPERGFAWCIDCQRTVYAGSVDDDR